MKTAIVIVWFKRDLRIHDHAPLCEAIKTGLPVLPLYIVEPNYWQQPFASRRHWHFIHDCLHELREDCQRLQQALVIRTGEATDVFSTLANQFIITTIYAHEETGNGWTYERDKVVRAWAISQAIALQELPCNGVVRGLKNRDDWAAIRSKRMTRPLLTKPNSITPLNMPDLGTIPDKSDMMFGEQVPGITQQGGRRAAVDTLKQFLCSRGQRYLYHLSAPGLSENHCSRLSPHLAWGTLSVAEVVRANKNRRAAVTTENAKTWKRNLSAFGSRLSWRCHFIQKIEDQPEIEFRCMHSAFEGMREFEHNNDYLLAWQQGRTGYPLVDACMRNLVYTGWITFRMRAMLISFASYQLWLDWRKTGYHMAQVFTDYEPGIHYSQLQMQSGVTGINTVRIYNPVKQSQEHDPRGHFIRRWVPELQHVSDNWIHEPWKMDPSLQQTAKCIIGKDYPSPIVDNTIAVKMAREKISYFKQQLGFKQQADNVYKKLGSRKKTLSPRKKMVQTNQLDLF